MTMAGKGKTGNKDSEEKNEFDYKGLLYFKCFILILLILSIVSLTIGIIIY